MSKKTKKLNLFISYCHKDENYIKKFITHLKPLKSKGLITEWYDRKINGGDEFQDRINNKLADADIICLFISADFLNSKACMQEKDEALKLRKKKDSIVVPIILRKCGWLEYDELSKLMALPNDGKPIKYYDDEDYYYYEVIKQLKEISQKRKSINDIHLKESFKAVLKSADLLKKAHPNKEEIFIKNIFVEPKFKKYDSSLEYDKSVQLESIKKDLDNDSKIVIAGEGQSGKTTLCKVIYLDLLKKGFLPIYLERKEHSYLGRMDLKLEKEFNHQYNSEIEFASIPTSRIIPIIDDFHLARDKEKHIEYLKDYNKQILVVDDIFSIDLKQGEKLFRYNHFTIMEFSPSKRCELIEKWIKLTPNKWSTQNELYQDLDSKTELVDSALGKIIGSGVMPSYPFFILSVISTYETFDKPLNQEITSQGYCYQALIYMYLRKQGVKNEDIDTYINFLTEFAYFLFSNKSIELSSIEFKEFLNEYNSNYNLSVDESKLLLNLRQTNIISLDSFNNYSFSYSYLYFFFIAKYLAENIDSNIETIEDIINNLHIDDNAYITIFISHHAKDDKILDPVILNSMLLFEKFEPATLSESELDFFDEKVKIISKAILPKSSTTSLEERAKMLEVQDEIEIDNRTENQKFNDVKKDLGIDEDIEDDDFSIDLRRSIKTVEVMGRIIKNRAGSLKKDKLEQVFKEAMNVHLRILNSFITLIKDEDSQNFIEEFIIKQINKKIKKEDKDFNNEELKKLSQKIFWNTNFGLIYAILDKIIHSLGSDKLSKVIENVCSDQDSPATFIIKHGILMWYNKNLQSDRIADRIDSNGFSKTSKEIMNHMIVSHCRTHNIGYKERQKIENRFQINQKALLTRK